MICPICGLDPEHEARIPDLLPVVYPLCPGCGKRRPIRDIDQYTYGYWLAAHRERMQAVRLLISQRNRTIRGYRPYPHHF